MTKALECLAQLFFLCSLLCTDTWDSEQMRTMLEPVNQLKSLLVVVIARIVADDADCVVIVVVVLKPWRSAMQIAPMHFSIA